MDNHQGASLSSSRIAADHSGPRQGSQQWSQQGHPEGVHVRRDQILIPFSHTVHSPVWLEERYNLYFKNRY